MRTTARLILLVLTLPLMIHAGQAIGADSVDDADDEDELDGNPLQTAFFNDGSYTVLQVVWSGVTRQVRSGFRWSLILPDGSRVPVCRLDWLGLHRMPAGAGYVGDIFLRYGPPLPNGNGSEVFAAAWIKVPLTTVGTFECTGYGRRALQAVLPRAHVALLADKERESVAPYSFRCLEVPEERLLLDVTPPEKRSMTIRWWLRGVPLATVEWTPETGPQARVRWERPTDADRPYFVDPTSGDLRVFDREALDQLACLRCARQGMYFATNAILSCRDPDENVPLPYEVRSDLAEVMTPSDQYRADVLRQVLEVTTWFVAIVSLLALVTLVASNLVALYRYLCFKCQRRTRGGGDGVGDAGAVHVDYEKLDDDDTCII